MKLYMVIEIYTISVTIQISTNYSFRVFRNI